MNKKDVQILEELFGFMQKEEDPSSNPLARFLQINKLSQKFISWEDVFKHLGDTFHTKSDVMEMIRRAAIPKHIVMQIIDMKEYQDLEHG